MLNPNIDYKIENWQNKLLDLGKRNKLLNYRLNSRGTLTFKVPEYVELWNLLVNEENFLEFPTPKIDNTLEDIESLNPFEVPEGTQPKVSLEKSEKKVDLSKTTDITTATPIDIDEKIETFKTNQSIEEMQRTLRGLRSKAKTSMEEQGINILYLCFGFLKWTESDSSRYAYTSPIVLVPVKLTVDSINSPFVLSKYEDEIVVNPTLMYKLENDFGVTLPQLEDDDTIETYLKKLYNITKSNGWEVTTDVSLGLLSFLKINMYNDLVKHRDMITSNPIVKMICGISEGVESSQTIDFSNFDFDRQLKPTDIYQIVDADTSQQEAILSAKNGLSFVLQGPPGTGKSQTITNIIAECLADGKKILFVSEKMAALEVVHKRLDSAGLTDFCLTLHNTKANKRAILDQLACVLALAEQKATLTDEAYQKLETLQQDKNLLNDYAKQLHTTVQPLGKTIYQVNGIIANLVDYEEIIFPVQDVGNTSQELYSRYVYLITQFSNTIQSMTDDYTTNPWNGTNITMLTNELRHDIGAKLNEVLPYLDGINSEFNTICNSIQLHFKASYGNTKALIRLLEVSKASPTVPTGWILGEDVTPLFDSISEIEALNVNFNQLRKNLEAQYHVIVSNDGELITLGFDQFEDYDTANSIYEGINQTFANKFPYNVWKLHDINLVRELFSTARDKYLQLQELSENLLKDYEESIFGIDYTGIYNRYKTDYTSVFKVFKKSYKEDRKQVRLCLKTIVKKFPDSMVLDVISKLREIDTLKAWLKDNDSQLSLYFGTLFTDEDPDFKAFDGYFKAFESLKVSAVISKELVNLALKASEMELTLKSDCEFLYDGLNTNWDSVRSALTWALEFKTLTELYHVNSEFVELVCTGGEFSNKCAELQTRINGLIAPVLENLDWYVSLYHDTAYLESLEYPTLKDRLNACANGLLLLEEWIDFKRVKEECQNVGLGEFVSKVEELKVSPESMLPTFKKRFFRLWLDAILPNYPAVLNFRRRNQESTITEFANLDRLQFEIAKARIRSILINNLPNVNNFTSGKDEYSTLKRELSKQRRIMPIRKLFNEIPNLLLQLKPCLMMSPLSVSLFLEAENYQFDVVIFDEASQVCTENAIGAISRGKQVIIAGDSKQLPPTSFFTSSTVSDGDFDNDDDYNDSDDYESILDEANLLPQKTLLWHYRSRHEHLIAFSNAKIYNNNLVTFPSNIDKVADNGVEYFYVKEGFYDRGGKKGNVIEAQRVVELIFEHIQKYPNRSLGVIAFGEVQQLAIDTVLRAERLKHQEFESFFNENKSDAFFIKNLENVQGDERDTIIFSIGYAKDNQGVFRMNFGPLSKSGGERRLNVAITRAKYNVKLVGSILPTDINVDKVSTQGPKLLREYIDFAMRGAEVLENAIVESDVIQHDSPFETAVYNVLVRNGYDVKTQVGCSGYRIDMAVKHPFISGVFVLGIECDGATYHSSRTARERDRLRQDVLENMGWKIYRIWSTDWIKDPIAEGRRLIKAVENAILSYSTNDTNNIIDTSTDTAEPESFINVGEKTQEDFDNQLKDKYGLLDYPLTDINYANYQRSGTKYINKLVTDIVSVEYPIHYDVLCQKVAPLCGYKKIGIKVRGYVDTALSKLTSKFVRKGDYIYPKNYDHINIYVPNYRKIDYISTEELAYVMQLVTTKNPNLDKDSIILETINIYGFKHSSKKITTAMESAYDYLRSN